MKDINAALYGLVYIFVSTKVIDSMLNGADISKFAIITTTKPDLIKAKIITELHRSATISSGKGAYLNNDVNIMPARAPIGVKNAPIFEPMIVE